MKHVDIQIKDWKKTIYEKTVLINDSGHYFDHIIKQIPSDKFNIIKYPSYDNLIANYEQITKNPCLVLLNEQQEKEIKTLQAYFRTQRFDYDKTVFLDYMNLGPFNEEQIMLLAEKNYFFKSILCFMYLQKELNLNPSHLYNINEEDFERAFCKEDFKGLDEGMYPKTYKHIKHEQYNTKRMLDCFYDDVTRYSQTREEAPVELNNFITRTLR